MMDTPTACVFVAAAVLTGHFVFRLIVIVIDPPERPREVARTITRKDGTRERWCANAKCHECPHITRPLPRARARNERGRWPHRSRR